MKGKIEVVYGSLTDGRETVLVNASNTNGDLGTGVSGAIYSACGGDDFQEEIYHELCDCFGGPMEPGEILVTRAGCHPYAKYVVHIAVMDYREDTPLSPFPDAQRIEKGCRKLWPTIESLANPPHSVAMVALGGGTGRMGIRTTTAIACTTLQEHLSATENSHIEKVVFYGYSRLAYIAMADVVYDFFSLPLDTLEQGIRDCIVVMRHAQEKKETE